MKSLSIYVDKWFITVAINKDGNIMPLTLPNGEDRIWLFFHEDVANSRIEYGKAYENDFRDNKRHYIGDVFALIEQGECYFTRYAGRREEIKEIFTVSNIFTHLHQALEQDENVDTYISFSADIPDVARLRFIEELEHNGFKVVESVARISHLALEECKMRNIFTDKGNYLVLVATNDNFHYSLYENKGDIFLRINEESLPGLGMDVRRRALVETIVDNLNKNSKLLKTQEEFEQECMRQDRYADTWLDKIARSRKNIPVAFEGISFAVAPNNPATVTIFPNKLDERTSGIVDEIVRKITEFVKGAGLQPHEINGIAFVGNTFTNQTFSRAINNRFIVSDDSIVTFTDIELPKVVSVYAHIDCDQFRGATEAFKTDARTKEILIQRAREEKEKKKKAEEEKRRQQAIIDSQKEAEREYNNAIENIERYESNHNYTEMLDWSEIALKHRPEDEYAKEKATLARQLIADQRASNRQFSTHLQRAKTAFAEERWSDAVSQAEMALEIRPNADEARQIKTEARRRMDVKEKVRDLINRAQLFFAQKLYAEALGEVGKVLNLDPSSAEAKEIQQKISEVNSEHERKISSLVSQLSELEAEKDFASAVKICESLIDEDANNIGKWTSKKERLISSQKILEENKRKLDMQKKEINKAHFDEDWVRLKFLCETYLDISQDKDISQFLDKANKRLEEQKVREAKNKALATINGLIIDRKINEAEKEINRFAQNYPSEYLVVKDLRSKLFSFDSEGYTQPNSKPLRKPIGFNSYAKEKVASKDDFFAPVKRTQKQNQPRKEIETKKSSTTTKDRKDDFFDRKLSSGDKVPTAENKITNNDFNF